MIPSGYVKIAIENGHRKFVSFPINSMVDLSIVMLIYQRVHEKLDKNQQT